MAEAATMSRPHPGFSATPHRISIFCSHAARGRVVEKRIGRAIRYGDAWYFDTAGNHGTCTDTITYRRDGTVALFETKAEISDSGTDIEQMLARSPSEHALMRQRVRWQCSCGNNVQFRTALELVTILERLAAHSIHRISADGLKQALGALRHAQNA